MRTRPKALSDLHMLALGCFRFEVAATAEGVAAALAIDVDVARALITDDLERWVLVRAGAEQ